MTPSLTRRRLLSLAGASSLTMAMAGALRAEGGPVPAPLPFAQTTPMRIGAAALRVRDLDLMTGFYRDVLGLAVLSRDASGAVLGTANTPLLHLIHRPDAPYEPGFEAGLYHIAFLMPSREDLARWLVHAAFSNAAFTGFADHTVSEASYLNDPEGNGLEVYADRPPGGWRWTDGSVTMGTYPLDIDAILALTDTTRSTYTAAPEALRIGHMHLRVGDVEAARGFYLAGLGMDQTVGRPDALFLSSGGYHHHVAANIWQSRGAGMRNPGYTGLDWFSVEIEGEARLDAAAQTLAEAGFAVTRRSGAVETQDPWGTGLRLVSV